MPTIPDAIWVGKLRWNPSVKSVPKDGTPISAPTDTKLTVDAATTRNPASKPGPASGSSTASTRRAGG